MLSFICASNDISIFEQCIVPSFNIQKNKDFEIILVDTTQKQYDSAAKALNEGAAKAKGEYLIFLHHDIVIENEDFIDELNNWISKNNFGVAGVAGAVKASIWNYSKSASNIISNIVNGEEKYSPGIRVTKTTACETLDECFFVIPKKLFIEHQFEELTPTWHLYCVEYCLWAKEHNYEVLLTPMYLWHKSAGASMNSNYFEALLKLRKKYKKDIYTTMGIWPRNDIIMHMIIIKYKLKNLLKRMHP